jgi:hypothetical protein
MNVFLPFIAKIKIFCLCYPSLQFATETFFFGKGIGNNKKNWKKKATVFLIVRNSNRKRYSFELKK